jgi:hypothetical protein
MKTKNNIVNQRATRFAIGFVLVALIAGIYFLFKPFPAGQSLEVQANAVQLPDLAAAPDQKLPLSQGSVKGYMPGGKLLPANPASESSAAQNLEIGSFPPGPSLAAEAIASRSAERESASIQNLVIGGGYVIENTAQGSRIVSPMGHVDPTSASKILYNFHFGGSDLVKADARGSRTIASSNAASARAAAPSEVQRNNVGGGYLLIPAGGGWVTVPNAADTAPASAPSAVQRIDTGGGYLLIPAGGGWVTVPPR